jgi:hypothetical protein
MISPDSDKSEGALQCAEYILAFISGGAEKYYQQANHNAISGHALTYWQVDPKRSLPYCIEKIAEFYNALKNSKFEPAPSQENDDSIILTEKNKKHPVIHHYYYFAPDLDLESRLCVINNTISSHKFNQCELNTAYADLTLETLPKKNKLITVKSSLRIAKPLSELIAATTTHKILPSKILPSLERIYDFG